jgi:hypothetical protein
MEKSGVIRKNEIRLEVLVGYSEFSKKEVDEIVSEKESIEDLVRDGMKICIFRRDMIGELVEVNDRKVVVRFIKKCGRCKVYGMNKVVEYRRRNVRFLFGY